MAWRAAWWLLQRGEREEAAYFYATAITVAGASAASALSVEERLIDKATAVTLARALVEPATYIICDGETLERSQADALYALVAEKADERAEGFGDIVRLLLEDAATEFREEAAQDL